MAQGPIGAVVAALLALPAGCDLPRDPDGTRDRVRGAVLPVALVAPALSEAEAAALDRLAADLEAKAEIALADLHAALDALEDGRVAVVLGGIPPDTPHAEEAAVSRPIGRAGTVMLLPAGENAMLLAANRAVAAAEEPGR